MAQKGFDMADNESQRSVRSRPKRSYKMTPKGLEYKLQTLLKERRKFETRISKKIQALQSSIAESEDYSIVIQMLEDLEEQGDLLTSAQENLCSLLETSNHPYDQDAERRYIEGFKGDIIETCKSAKQYISMQPSCNLQKDEDTTFDQLSYAHTRSLFTPPSENESELETSPEKYDLKESKLMISGRDYREHTKNVVAFADDQFRLPNVIPKYSDDSTNVSQMYKSQGHFMTEPSQRTIPNLPLLAAGGLMITPPQQKMSLHESLDEDGVFKRNKPRVRLKSTNPFDADYETPLIRDQQNKRFQSMNPFGGEYKPVSIQHQRKKSTNPFDSDFYPPSGQSRTKLRPGNQLEDNYRYVSPQQQPERQFWSTRQRDAGNNSDLLEPHQRRRFQPANRWDEVQEYPYSLEGQLRKNFQQTTPGERFQQKFPSYDKSDQVRENASEYSDLTKMFCRLLHQQSAPDVDIEKYDGNPLNFHHFKAMFKEVVENNVLDPRGRLTRLIKFTTGDAKNLIQHCIQLPEATGYRTAMRLLERTFGDPYSIVAAYRKEIKDLPAIKRGDETKLRQFHHFLIKCQSISYTLSWNALNNPETICNLLSKLPYYLVDKWNRRVFKIRRTKKQEPDFDDFVDFIEEEATLIMDPMYSRFALDATTKDKRPNIRSYNTNAEDELPLLSKCSRCQKDCHDLDDCEEFLAGNVNDRSKWLKDNRRCYGCYEPISPTHNARLCKQRRICKVCQGKHPTGLHGYRHPKPPEIKCNSAEALNSDAKCISMCVVPVKVSSRNTSKVINTFAILDSCSQGTFVSNHLLDSLQVSGPSTAITVKTLSGAKRMSTKVLSGLQVKSMDNSAKWIDLPKCYSQQEIDVSKEEIATSERIKRWEYLHKIENQICQKDDVKIGILIGANSAECLEPIEIIPSENGGPYALKSKLGWVIIGPLAPDSSTNHHFACNRIITHQVASNHLRCFASQNPVKDTGISDLLKKLYQNEFTEQQLKVPHPLAECLENVQEFSQNDVKFLKIMKKEAKFEDGHYVLPLPLKSEIDMPNNRSQVLHRLLQLKKRLQRDQKLTKDYRGFMQDMLQKGYARKALTKDKKGQTWYIPHFAVYDPNKPDKVRIVFDCSAEYKGTSLNKHLISGPDLTNQLLGVLFRFRQHQTAFIADIEKMFYQVRVPETQRCLLRFLWWEDGDFNGDPVDYEMNVHIFGAVSSPGCSNYALKMSACNPDLSNNDEANTTIRKNFYVDDLLKSVQTTEKAIQLIKEVTYRCKMAGFNLTKFTTNSIDVLLSVPEEKRRKTTKEFGIKDSQPSTEKALGVIWNTAEDMFGFDIKKKVKPLTRRGILSVLSSIYDPCGFVAPYILTGRKIIQELCQNVSGWDDPLPSKTEQQWSTWLASLGQLSHIKIPRCYQPTTFGKVVHYSLHHFSDASTIGYGQVTYLRLVNEKKEVHCSFVVGKSRVTPIKYVSIPRLELTAAVLSVKISTMVKEELELDIDQEYFWTDSCVVLSYIKNDEKRFKTFVANRIQNIRENSEVSNWFYIPTKQNPADCSSRGLFAVGGKQDRMWQNGPEFLWSEPLVIPNQQITKIEASDPEVSLKACATKLVTKSIIDHFEENVSNWPKMKRIMAYVKRFISILKSKVRCASRLSTAEIEAASRDLVKLAQQKYWHTDFHQLINGDQVNGKLLTLNPFLDENKVMRVGGRLTASNLPESVMHPIILPRESQITTRVVEWCHANVVHGGRGQTLNEVRSSGFWIPSANKFVRSVIFKCVKCRFLRGKVGEQIMAELPKERVQEAPPFTYVGLDMFGPFIVKRGRAEAKRYGTMFTCLACRAVHIEVAHSLTTDSFILALRRLIARRGNVRYIRSDNGTNFIGAKAELQRAFKEMDKQRVEEFLKAHGADWIVWKQNTPTASHHGGVWERQIRSARAILVSLLKCHQATLTDESLQTLMTEVEGILNCRPLTVETISDVNSLQPLTPSMLLTQKTKVIMPPPGSFSSTDTYSRKQWRRTQHLVQEFWSRWRKEFLATLQEREKWKRHRRNLRIGDVILLKEETGRANWPMGRVTEVFPDNQGRVRSVKIKMENNREALRPISKIVLLLESEIVRNPDEEP